jgi:hypothetical protein
MLCVASRVVKGFTIHGAMTAYQQFTGRSLRGPAAEETRCYRGWARWYLNVDAPARLGGGKQVLRACLKHGYLNWIELLRLPMHRLNESSWC